jgi:hypothetical protein
MLAKKIDGSVAGTRQAEISILRQVILLDFRMVVEPSVVGGEQVEA